MRAARVLVLIGLGLAMLACSSTEASPPQQTDAAGGSSQDAGSEDGLAPEGSAGEAGCDPQTQATSDQCKACVTATGGDAGVCTAPREACVADTECTAIITCWQGCKEPQCESACITEHPDGTDTLLPFMACVDTTCHDECFCTGCRFGAAKCNPCLVDHCMQACSGCDRDTQCMSLVYCMVYTCAADDTACQNACGDKYDAGVNPYVGMATCGQEQCTTECGFETPDGGDDAGED